MKRKWWLAAAGLLAASLITWAVLSRVSARQEGESEAGPGSPVVVAFPRIGPIQQVLSASGTLKPAGTIRLTSRIPGRIEEILVEEGQRVVRGQTVVQMEGEAVRLQADQAYAAWRVAEAQYEKARQGVRPEELENARALYEKAQKDVKSAEGDFLRVQELYRAGVLAKVQFEEAQSKLRAAKTDLENARRTVRMLEQGASREDQEAARAQAEAARSRHELARLKLGYTRIEAPGSGVVAGVLQDEGNAVGTATPILLLVKDDPIRLEVAVAERYYGRIAQRWPSMEARIRPVAYPEGNSYRGRIASVAPTIDPASRTFTVTVELDNPEGKLRPGMYAEVDLVLERVPEAVLVPLSAVVQRSGRTLVFVVRRSGALVEAEARAVSVGIAGEQWVQVAAGLSAEQEIIVEGNAFLEDGQRITIVEGG